MSSIGDHYEDARGTALSLPTWVLLVWERRATRRLSRGAPTAGEKARLLAVRIVLRERDPIGQPPQATMRHARSKA